MVGALRRVPSLSRGTHSLCAPRTQHEGEPYRTFFAFDPRRCAILLIGGTTGGSSRFYERYLPIADRLYQQHLDELRKEGRIS